MRVCVNCFACGCVLIELCIKLRIVVDREEEERMTKKEMPIDELLLT